MRESALEKKWKKKKVVHTTVSIVKKKINNLIYKCNWIKKIHSFSYICAIQQQQKKKDRYSTWITYRYTYDNVTFDKSTVYL